MKLFYVWHIDLRFRNKTHFQRPLSLAQSEHELVLLVRKSAYIAPEIVEAVSHLVRLPFKLPGFLDHLLLFFYSMGYFLLTHRKHKLEAIYTTPHVSLILGFFVKTLFKRRFLWICDIWDDPRRVTSRLYLGKSRKIFNYFYNSLVQRILRVSDIVITIGSNLDQELPLVLQREFHVPREHLLYVTNGVDLEMFKPENCRKEVSCIYKLFFVGYVNPDCGVGTLLEATSLLKDRIGDLKLVLVGFTQPDEVIWLEGEIDRLGLHEHVDFLGIVESAEIPNLIAASDICIHPFPATKDLDSVYPIKVYEYLAMSKPVISSDLTATRKIIKDGVNGILVKPEDPVAMAEAIQRIFEDRDLRQRFEQNARPSVEAFSWQVINKKIIDRLLDVSTLERSI